MGIIRENFILVDGFSAVFSRFLSKGDESVQTTEQLDQALRKAGNAARRGLSGQGGNALNRSLRSSARSAEQLSDAMGKTRARTRQISGQSIRNVQRDAQAAAAAMDGLGRSAQGANAQMSGVSSAGMDKILRHTEQCAQEMLQVVAAIREMNNAANAAAAQGIDQMAEGIEEVAKQTDEAANAQKRHNKLLDAAGKFTNKLRSVLQREVAGVRNFFNTPLEEAGNSANRLLSVMQRLAAVAAGGMILRGVIGLSDTLAQTKARLDGMNDGLQTTAELQDMIFRSSLRSRSAYASTADFVAKLGQRTGGLFSSAEAVQFAENLNKKFAIAGATQEETASATLQLTQALGAGVLRGEEFNAIFEAAPNVIQEIADYLDVPIGEMKELAGEGMITAEAVKNAMLAATDDINAEFERIPMTFE